VSDPNYNRQIIRLINIDGLLPPAHWLITFSLNRLCKRFLDVLNVFFLLVSTYTSAGTVPLKLEKRIKSLSNIIKKIGIHISKCLKITHILIRTLVEYTTLVYSLFRHFVLHHNLLPTLAASNDREFRPVSGTH